MIKEKLVKIVIPIYRPFLSRMECDIVLNNLEVLSRYEFVFVVPKSLLIDRLNEQIGISNHTVLRVSDDWLGHKNGISGYNKMMMSKEFYDNFLDAEYILVCQSDAFVFRDDLQRWCSQGFDYVGAPWIRRRIYDRPILKQYLALRRFFFSRRLNPIRQDLLNKVGNGGFSLRHIDNFIKACEKYTNELEHFKRSCTKRHLFNEDVFWAIMPEEFSYPSVGEALDFSFDQRPDLCYEMNGGKLPFACHGLTQRRLFNFWRDKIDLLTAYGYAKNEKKVTVII